MTRDFFQRFNIETTIGAAKDRFVNRALNLVFQEYFLSLSDSTRFEARKKIVTLLGDRYDSRKSLEQHIGGDFVRTLQALEAFWGCWQEGTQQQAKVEQLIVALLHLSEVDLGIRWRDGCFYPAGAAELDNALVNDVLTWIEGSEFAEVKATFKKALDHLMASTAKPDLRKDVITDAYEALESLAKIVTGNDRDLSANRELFLSKLNGAAEAQRLMREYIEYGCEYRHGVLKPGRSIPSESDTEMYLYMTGALMRRALMAHRAR